MTRAERKVIESIDGFALYCVEEEKGKYHAFTYFVEFNRFHNMQNDIKAIEFNRNIIKIVPYLSSEEASFAAIRQNAYWADEGKLIRRYLGNAR